MICLIGHNQEPTIINEIAAEFLQKTVWVQQNTGRKTKFGLTKAKTDS